MPAHWLVKQEPGDYPFSRLVADGKTAWEGVRNHQARNYLREMARGDLVLYYHTGDEKAVVGVARVTRPAFADPTAPPGEEWVAVELEAVRALARPVPLAEVKRDRALAGMALVRVARLSVQPVAPAEFERVLELGGK